MEIRCGGCNKLFRIPDEKITGKGIKFACTRCGEYVKVTKEEFEQYSLSKSAVSVLDMFEAKPKPAQAPLPAQAAEAVTEERAPAVKDIEHAAPAAPGIKPEAQVFPVEEPPAFAEPTDAAKTKDFAHGAPSDFDIKQEEQAPPLGEPSPTAEPAPEPARESKGEPRKEPGQAPIKESKPEPPQQPASGPKQEPAAEPSPALKPEPAVSDTYPRRAREPKTETARTASPAATLRSPLSAPPVKSAPLTTEAPIRSMNMFFVYFVMLIIIGLVGYGVFTYIGPGTQKVDELSKQISSTEGLRIVTTSGSVEPNGDLLITCVIENSMNRERPVWYVVASFYNTQGALFGKIRSLNGKQLYTQRDYEILSQRGVNVQELKAKNLQDQGITIPPRGSVTFEIRYLLPSERVENFNALLHPFDPVRLFKELAEEIR